MFFYFVAQTGRMSLHAFDSGNFYQYKIPFQAYRKVEETVLAARLGSGGLEYPPLFLSWLSKIDLNK